MQFLKLKLRASLTVRRDPARVKEGSIEWTRRKHYWGTKSVSDQRKNACNQYSLEFKFRGNFKLDAKTKKQLKSICKEMRAIWKDNRCRR